MLAFVRDYWQPTAAAKLTYTCRRYHVLCTSEVAETNYITPSAINWTITYAPPWDTISIFFGFTKSKSVLGYEPTVFLSEQKHAHTHTHTPFSKRLYIINTSLQSTLPLQYKTHPTHVRQSHDSCHYFPASHQPRYWTRWRNVQRCPWCNSSSTWNDPEKRHEKNETCCHVNGVLNRFANDEERGFGWCLVFLGWALTNGILTY